MLRIYSHHFEASDPARQTNATPAPIPHSTPFPWCYGAKIK
jgi:hypothetical protein